MESTESPLDVLSRAATMVQGNNLPTYDEAQSYAKYKELTLATSSGGKWKRERKQRTISMLPPEYSSYIHKSGVHHAEPIDMSTRRTRGSPPSYTQTMCTSSLVRSGIRPSVITCMQQTPTHTMTDRDGGVCDPVIDEHFRRSLGKDYLSIFSDHKQEDIREAVHSSSAESDLKGDIVGSALSVDDHFAKALGETWLKLQRGETKVSSPSASQTSSPDSETTSTLLRQRANGVVSI